ncbi:unnamed protein product, partial [Brassica oleracea var. botrytis]
VTYPGDSYLNGKIYADEKDMETWLLDHSYSANIKIN